MRGRSQVCWVEAEHNVRGRAPWPWVAQNLCGQPSPCPAHPIPGFWADVRGFRLLTLKAFRWSSARCRKGSWPNPHEPSKAHPQLQLAPPGPIPHLSRPPPFLANSAVLPGGQWSLPLPIGGLSLGRAIGVLNPRNSGPPGRVLWERGRGVKGGHLVPPTAQ